MIEFLPAWNNEYLPVSLTHYNPMSSFLIAQSAGAVEYTDCTSAEG